MMKKIYSIYLLILISTITFGQTEKMINPADLKQQTIVTEPLSLQKGFLRVGLFYSFSTADRYFNGSGKKLYLEESTWETSRSTQLWIQYGITDRLMFAAGIPYANEVRNYHSTVYYPEYDSQRIYNLSSRGKGFGDMIIGSTYQIIPSADNDFSLRLATDLTIPTGKKNPGSIINGEASDAPTGLGVFVLTPQVTARYILYPFSFTGYVHYGYYFRGSKLFSPTDTIETRFRYGDFLYIGGSVNLHLNDWIALTNDLNFLFTGKGEVSGVPESKLNTTWVIADEIRLIFQIRRFRLGESVKIPVKGKNISADPQYTMVAQYVF